MSALPEVGSDFLKLAGESAAPPRTKNFQRLNPLESPGWDESLLSHRAASVFHSSAWARVLNETYGHSPHYFCSEDKGRLSELLPVMEVNSPWTGRRGVALPFTDECPHLSDGSTSAHDFLHNVIDFGRKRRWKYLECRGAGGLFKETAPSVSFFGHLLPLSDGKDRIFSRLDSSVRRAVRKAESAKIQLEISGSLDSLLTYYSLHCRTRKKHGLPPQPLAFFRNIFERVMSKEQGVIVVAKYQDRPIAAAMFLHFDDKAVYKYGASDPAFQNLRANNLVMWEAIKWYSARGYASLHFGRTSISNEGLRRYKLGFGTEEHRIDYFKYDFRKEAFVSDRDKVFGWFNAVFRVMPVPLARAIGMLLYRHQS